MARIALHITGDDKADAVLSRDPLALLIGMVLDQQVTIEKAFSSPADLVAAARHGARSTPPPSPPWTPTSWPPSSGSGRPCTATPAPWPAGSRPSAVSIADEYGDKADNIWKGVQSGDELLGRLRALPGFGEQKAKIFAALLGKQLGVRPDGWRRPPPPTARRAARSRWPTSPTPRAWPRSGRPRRP